MNPNEIQDLVELLIEIGGSLAEAGFELAVRRATFLGASNIFWAILMLAVGVFLIKTTIKFSKNHQEEKYAMWDLYATLTGVGGGICFLITPFLITSALDYIINPKWQAVQMLMKLITGGD